MSERVTVRVPATSANLGPGYDCLGIAIDLENVAEIQIQFSGTGSLDIINISGEGSEFLARDERNLFIKAMRHYESQSGAVLPSCQIALTNQIPLSRGLGSSAATIVGGIYAAASIVGAEISKDEATRQATVIEGHPDNVAAAIYGGLTVACLNESGDPNIVRFETSDKISTVIVIPGEKLGTKEARAALKETVSRKDAVFNIARASVLVGSLIEGKCDGLNIGVEDRLHQPQRMPLLPHYKTVRGLFLHNEVGAMALSGAGPSMIAFVDSDRAQHVANGMRNALAKESLGMTVITSPIVNHGVQVISDL